jgi:endosialidase-like protein
MKPASHGLCALAALAVLWPSPARAQTPLGTVFTYQGQLKQSGSPANGSFSMVFKLFDAATLGNQVGPTLFFTGMFGTPLVSVTNGLFAVQLDFGAVYNGDKRWLEITVGGTTLAPRQELTAAPYARFSAAPWATAGADISSTNTGNVGIGTTPSEKLDVNGNVAIRNNHALKIFSNGVALTSTSPASNVFDFYRTGDLNPFVRVGSSDSTARAFAIRTGDGIGAAEERLVIIPNGNVGIGTMNPVSRLHVRSPFESGIALSIDSFGMMDQPATVDFLQTGTARWSLGKSSQNDFFVDEAIGARRFTVQQASGNVGIGTATPGAKLDVQGAVKVVDGTQGAGKVLTSDANGLASWQSPAVSYWSANGNDIFNTNTGKVGIGTTTPTASLTIAGPNNSGASSASIELTNTTGGGSSTYSLRSTNGGQFQVVHSIIGTLMVVTNLGNVGIGTTPGPSNKLEVSGQGVFNGPVSAQSFNVTSDARFKDHVKPLAGALNKIERLRGVTFDWKRDEFRDHAFAEGPQIGFIAQEVEKILPQVVSKGTDGYLSVDYSRLTPILVEAIKEQQKEVRSLKAENAALKARLERIEDRLVAAVASSKEGAR